MRLDELLDTARRNRDEQQALAALTREAERRAAAEELARRDAAFRKWLGDLAEDLGIGEPAYGMNPDVTVWSLRPRIEGLVEGARIEVVKSQGRSCYTFKIVYPKGYGPAADVYSAADAGLPYVLLNLQSWNEVELAARIASWEKELATPRDRGCSDDVERLRAARDKLNELAPEQSARWAEIHARSVSALVDWQTEEAEKAAVRAAAVERYTEALEAWADECAAVDAHNAAVVAGLREDLGDVSRDVVEIEFAVFAEDEEGPHVETDFAWATAVISNDTYTVIENGRERDWTFRHVVRVSGPETVRPADRPELFLQWWSPAGTDRVFYLPRHGDRVEAAKRSLREYPAEPSWNVYGGGLPGGRDVYEAAGRARGRRAAVESDPF